MSEPAGSINVNWMNKNQRLKKRLHKLDSTCINKIDLACQAKFYRSDESDGIKRAAGVEIDISLQADDAAKQETSSV